ncbi:MAG: hypothetical protein EB053_01480 [Chlamydiae bacterium]|nr:hypothetical protein [Chlamydiota bacterium]
MLTVSIKKLLVVLGLSPMAGFLFVPTDSVRVEQVFTVNADEARSENELSTLEQRFLTQSSFDSEKINEAIKIRLMESGSMAPMKGNLDAMLILWDAGVRDPNVFVAALLKDTTIDQTVVVHLYGPEVSALLNEMSTNDQTTISENAKMILDAFQAADESK